MDQHKPPDYITPPTIPPPKPKDVKMKKSQLKVKPHTMRYDNQVVEVWYEGKMIASVYGTDGPGVRVLTKHPFDIVRGGAENIRMVEVQIEPVEGG